MRARLSTSSLPEKCSPSVRRRCRPKKIDAAAGAPQSFRTLLGRRTGPRREVRTSPLLCFPAAARDVSNLYAAYFSDPMVTPASTAQAAALAAATAYLDGKPTRAARKISRAQRDVDFWSCPHWREVPVDTWRSNAMTLALARYFAQEVTINVELLER